MPSTPFSQGMNERLSASTSEPEPGCYLLAVDPAVHAQPPAPIRDVEDSGADHVRLVGLSQGPLFEAVSCCQSPETYRATLEALEQQHEQRPVTVFEAPGVDAELHQHLVHLLGSRAVVDVPDPPQ